MQYYMIVYGTIIRSSIAQICMRESHYNKTAHPEESSKESTSKFKCKKCWDRNRIIIICILNGLNCPLMKSIIPRPVRKKPLRKTIYKLSRKLHLHKNVIIETLTCMQSDKISTSTSSWTIFAKSVCNNNNEDTTAPTIELIGCHSAAWMAAATRTKGPEMHTAQ